MNNNEITYWSNFYNNRTLSLDNSNFSVFVYKFINDNIINDNLKNNNIRLLDIGCGNGKDTYFLSKYFTCLGIDSSFKPNNSDNSNNCNFVISDFVKYDKSGFDIIYSRFTLHSITDEMQEELFKSINSNTYFFIETRSDKGISNKRFYGDEHYRNFTNFEKIKKMLNEYNFEIMYEYEGNGCAIYKKEDPICIRLVCYKK